jgi:hypothetical protein
MHGVQSESYLEHDSKMKDAAAQTEADANFLAKLKLKLREQHTEVMFISGAQFGMEFFNKILDDAEIKDAYQTGKLKFTITSDRENKVSLEKFTNGIYAMLPQYDIDSYKGKNPSAKILGSNVDLLACESIEKLEAGANSFAEANPVALAALEKVAPTRLLALGGRVQHLEGHFQENTVEAFEYAAQEELNRLNGKNGLITTHGLRSFTKSDGSNDMAPVKAFINKMQQGLQAEQKLLIFTKVVAADGKGRDTKVLLLEGGNNTQVIEAQANANAYNYLIKYAVEHKLPMSVTEEQTTFPSEVVKFAGCDRGVLKTVEPIRWDITIPSTHKFYENLTNKLTEKARIVDAEEAYKMLLLAERVQMQQMGKTR